MTLSIAITVSISLGIYALFSFMLAVFAGGSVVNNHQPGKIKVRILDLFIYLLPGSAIFSVTLVWYAFLNKGTTNYPLWLAIPLVPLLAYFMLLVVFRRN